MAARTARRELVLDVLPAPRPRPAQPGSRRRCWIPARSPIARRSCELRETHISWVFLAGDNAYKVKKPVALPFLDYGTLARRRACCAEEVRAQPPLRAQRLSRAGRARPARPDGPRGRARARPAGRRVRGRDAPLRRVAPRSPRDLARGRASERDLVAVGATPSPRFHAASPARRPATRPTGSPASSRRRSPRCAAPPAPSHRPGSPLWPASAAPALAGFGPELARARRGRPRARRARRPARRAHPARRPDRGRRRRRVRPGAARRRRRLRPRVPRDGRRAPRRRARPRARARLPRRRRRPGRRAAARLPVRRARARARQDRPAARRPARRRGRDERLATRDRARSRSPSASRGAPGCPVSSASRGLAASGKSTLAEALGSAAALARCSRPTSSARRTPGSSRTTDAAPAIYARRGQSREVYGSLGRSAAEAMRETAARSSTRRSATPTTSPRSSRVPRRRPRGMDRLPRTRRRSCSSAPAGVPRRERRRPTPTQRWSAHRSPASAAGCRSPASRWSSSRPCARCRACSTSSRRRSTRGSCDGREAAGDPRAGDVAH